MCEDLLTIHSKYRLQPHIFKTSKQVFIFHNLSCNNNFMAVGDFFYIYAVQVHSGNEYSTSNWIKKIREKYY